MREIGKRSVVYFAASVASVVTALVTLPLATRILGPADYGAYAIAVTASLIVQSIAGAPHMYVIPANLGRIDAAERSLLVTTAVVNAFIVACVLTLSLGGLALTEFASFLTSEHFRGPSILLIVAATLAIAPCLVAMDVLPLDGRANAFATLTILQSAASAAGLLVSLFALHLGAVSLYVAYFTGSAAAGVTALLALRRDLTFGYSSHWLHESLRHTLSTISQRISESGYMFVERSVLATSIGMRSVGLYVHAQLYSSASLTIVNALSRGMLPLNMEEARESPPLFRRTFHAWIPIQLFVVTISAGFALVGDAVIDLLTNGKFTNAHFMGYLLIVALAVQTGGKGELSFLLAHGHGRTLARVNISAIACGLVALLAATPLIGAIGAPIAIIVRSIVVRLGVIVMAGRTHRIPFQDGPMLAGLAISSMLAFWVFRFEPSLISRAIVAVPVIAVGLLLIVRLVKVLWKSPGSRDRDIPITDAVKFSLSPPNG